MPSNNTTDVTHSCAYYILSRAPVIRLRRFRCFVVVIKYTMHYRFGPTCLNNSLPKEIVFNIEDMSIFRTKKVSIKVKCKIGQYDICRRVYGQTVNAIPLVSLLIAQRFNTNIRAVLFVITGNFVLRLSRQLLTLFG